MTRYISTYTGKKFHFLDPDPSEIDIYDIAHSLSMTCRFTGHTSKFYSVAEHCVHMSVLCTEEPLQALLHDATEAYLNDISSPIKYHLDDYSEFEDGIWSAITRRFGVPYEWSEELKVYDKDLCYIEGHKLMPPTHDWLSNTVKLKDYDLKLWNPSDAKNAYLNRFAELI